MALHHSHSYLQYIYQALLMSRHFAISRQRSGSARLLGLPTQHAADFVIVVHFCPITPPKLHCSALYLLVRSHNSGRSFPPRRVARFTLDFRLLPPLVNDVNTEANVTCYIDHLHPGTIDMIIVTLRLLSTA